MTENNAGHQCNIGVSILNPLLPRMLSSKKTKQTETKNNNNKKQNKTKQNKKKTTKKQETRGHDPQK